MSGEEHHIQYVPEPPKVKLTFVGWTAFGMLLLLIAAIGGFYGIYHAAGPTRVLPAPQEFPQPRVDTRESEELRRIRETQSAKLRTWRWSDDQHSSVQIPIERAMELIAQRGLPVHTEAAAAAEAKMAGENVPVVTAPLTNGFARTGYEQEKIEERKQKLEFSKAEGAEHASLAPMK